MKSIQQLLAQQIECLDFLQKRLDDIELKSYTGDGDRYSDCSENSGDEGLSVL